MNTFNGKEYKTQEELRKIIGDDFIKTLKQEEILIQQEILELESKLSLIRIKIEAETT